MTDDDLYRVDGPVNLARMSALDRCRVDHRTRTTGRSCPGLPDRLRDSTDLLATIRQHDVLLHHPFQSFDPVVEFIRRAADDPDVVAIKQTVYRTGVNSVLMEALIDAARRGKEVTVVVELLARFDEEANINWAEKLEQVGAQVVYGVFGLKTHAKLALLLRRENDAKGRTRLQSYAHLGTGNYHPRTARLYTDFGLLTANKAICADVNDVFLHITSLAKAKRLQAPAAGAVHDARPACSTRSGREARNAREGKPARIIAKMNALIEEAVIRALYTASQAGVRDRPHRPRRVRAAAGRRRDSRRTSACARSSAGSSSTAGSGISRTTARDEVWLASADWMGRNLFRRIEVAFPVLDPELKARVINEGLKPYLADNCDAWVLAGDGTYARLEGVAPVARRAPRSSELVERLAEQPEPDT